MWELKLTNEDIRNEASVILSDLLLNDDESNINTQFKKVYELTKNVNKSIYAYWDFYEHIIESIKDAIAVNSYVLAKDIMIPLLENLRSMNFMQTRIHYQENRLDKIVSKKRLNYIFKAGETVTDHHFTCLEIQRIIRLLSHEIKTLNHPTLDMEVGSLMKRITEHTYAYEYWRKKMTKSEKEAERVLYDKVQHYLSEAMKYLNNEIHESTPRHS